MMATWQLSLHTHFALLEELRKQADRDDEAKHVGSKQKWPQRVADQG